MYNSFTSLTGVAYPLKETFTFYTERVMATNVHA